MFNDFLRDEFNRDVQDAWAYSSIQDKEKYNVCFRPEIAHDLLKLEGTLICKKEKADEISVHCIAIGSKTENKVYFYPLGSEQQKSIFPEILTK